MPALFDTGLQQPRREVSELQAFYNSRSCHQLNMSPPSSKNDQGSDTNWAARVDATANSDQRTKPWETVVETTNVETKEGDVIDVVANPQGACDISVSA